ncbi:MAG: protoporphyrinogen oxidase [Candidatus Omnitrophota bacterium]
MFEKAERPLSPRVLVVGGGLSGLAAAYRLLELSRGGHFPLELFLAEAGERLGGVIGTSERDGFLLESGPDCFMTDKPWALNLCERLGLEGQLVATSPEAKRSFVIRRGRLIPVPEGFYLLAPSRIWPFVTTSLFSPFGKLRMALEWFVPRKKSFRDESVASFVRRRFGAEALSRMAQPLIGSIYATDLEVLSLQAALPRFLEMEREYGSVIRAIRSNARTHSKKEDPSGPRYGLFLSFQKGMQTLTDRLADSLPRGTVFLNTPVVRLAPEAGGGWSVAMADQRVVHADALCLAVPAFGAAKLLRETDANLAAILETIPYASSTSVHLTYQRSDILHPLDGSGFVVPETEHLPIVGCSFSSIKFPGRSPGKKALLRVFLAADEEPAPESFADEEFCRRIRPTLEALLGIKASPLFVDVMCWPQSLPQYHVGHLEKMREVEKALGLYPGLALAGNAYAGVGVPDCVHSGEEAAERLFETLQARTKDQTGVLTRESCSR